MKLCNNCNSYSYGNELCYKCYHKKLSEMIIQDKSKNKCVKCQSFIYQNGYCERCYNNNVPLNHNELIAKYQLIKKCKKCEKAVFDNISDYCYDHYYELFIASNNIDSTHKTVKKPNNNLNQQYYKSLEALLNMLSNNEHTNTEYKSFKDFNDNKKYTCKSGIKVRSLSEKIISDFLTENGIKHEYEKEFSYLELKGYSNLREKTLHPDFYIPGPVDYQGRTITKVFIEFWGLDNNEYNNVKNYKLAVYKYYNLTLINVNSEDLIDINTSLKQKLLTYKEHTIN